eukprot:GHVS01093785.1.p1 GENE.GHVS01093785.1~~GHVS01093785.1.p1  ORF type:complete len:119 (+),score=0.05 GHVS01093785.1:749-1105(+)
MSVHEERGIHAAEEMRIGTSVHGDDSVHEGGSVHGASVSVREGRPSAVSPSVPLAYLKTLTKSVNDLQLVDRHTPTYRDSRTSSRTPGRRANEPMVSEPGYGANQGFDLRAWMGHRST